MPVLDQAREGGDQAAAAARDGPLTFLGPVELGGPPVGDDDQWLLVRVHGHMLIASRFRNPK